MTSKEVTGAFAVMFLLLSFVTISIAFAAYEGIPIVISSIFLSLFTFAGFVVLSIMYFKYSTTTGDEE